LKNNAEVIVKRPNRNPILNYIKRNVGMLAALVGMGVIISIFQPNFLTSRNFFNIIRSISMIAILAYGMTLCIIIQGIDLARFRGWSHFLYVRLSYNQPGAFFWPRYNFGGSIF
jgi:predicted ABC-type sugar transport system permease subunit